MTVGAWKKKGLSLPTEALRKVVIDIAKTGNKLEVSLRSSEREPQLALLNKLNAHGPSFWGEDGKRFYAKTHRSPSHHAVG